jgi:thiosulfate/3-mercaptopyruvate sulfurtransferase
MAKQVGSKGRIVLAGLCGVVALSVLAIWGCGTKGYDDVAAQRQAVSDAAVTTTKAPAVIDAATLKSWVDQGKLNAASGNPDRVVIVSLASFAAYSTSTRGHIPGAVLMETSTDLTDTREEGLGAVSSMMLTSTHMDTVVKKFGIDGNTTIVLTIPKKASDSETYQQSVAYFTYRYWGFARNRIKILNGGDDAWDFAGYPLATHARTVVAPSSYSVKSNGRLKDVVRYSISETLALVDAINKDPGLLASWQMLDARGFTTTPYVANALRAKDPLGTSHGMMFLNDRVNGEATRNRLYPDKATLLTRMATIPVVNGSADQFLAPDKKTLVMCGSSTSASPTFVLFDAVLGVPEGNIAMYDGSSGQWGNYATARLSASALAGGATAQQAADLAAAWAFDAVTPGTTTTRSTGGALTGTGALLPYLYLPTLPEMNQVEEADRAFMGPASTGTTVPTGGNTGGGNAGGGC